MSVKITDVMKPFGSGAAAISMRSLIEKLKLDYKQLEGEIEVSCMMQKYDYIFYFNLPSKSNKKYPDDKVYYDIVLQFSPPGSAFRDHQSIHDWDLKVFSNMPNFMFTFTYAFKAKKGLIDFPTKYFSKKALKERPKMKNPYLFLGIDEGLYHCIMYMDRHHMFDRTNIEELVDSSDLDWKSLLDSITSQEEKLLEANNRDLRHRALTRRKNSKVWASGSNKNKIKQQLLEEYKNIREETASTPEGYKKKEETLKANMNARLSLSGLKINKDKNFMKTDKLKANNLKANNMKWR